MVLCVATATLDDSFQRSIAPVCLEVMTRLLQPHQCKYYRHVPLRLARQRTYKDVYLAHDSGDEKALEFRPELPDYVTI